MFLRRIADWLLKTVDVQKQNGISSKESVAGRLIRDTAGLITATDHVLVTTLIAIGVLAGLTTYRDSIVQEFGDVAVALDSLDQSYEYELNGVLITDFNDTVDLTDPANSDPAGISVTVAPTAGE